MSTRRIREDAPPSTTVPAGTNDAAIAGVTAAGNTVTTTGTPGGAGFDYSPPGRYAKDKNDKWIVYTGAGLVQENGHLLLGEDGKSFYYDVNGGADYKVWASLGNPKKRLEIMQQLADAGFLSKSSIGDYGSEVNAVGQWLIASNFAGLERNNFLKQRLSGGAVAGGGGGGGGGTTYRVSNAADLRVIAKKISQETLGRELSDADVEQFVRAYQSQELGIQKQSGSVVSQGMSSDVAAQKFAQDTAPTEAKGYEYLGYVNQFVNAIGSL